MSSREDLSASRAGAARTGAATVTAIHVSTGSRAPLRKVERVQAVLDTGLEGDRHARPGRGRQVLLMEHEVLDAFGLAPGDVREQITVRNMNLYTFAEGTRMRVGGAILEFAEPCAPCERMNEVRPGLMTALEGKRGRFVRVAQAGTIAVGDALEPESPPGP